jgi:transcriptional regulator with XRE-family HTH domain
VTSRVISPSPRRLKRQLKEHGVSQHRIAEEAHVTRTMVSHVLSGRKRSAPIMAAIARLLDVGASPSFGRGDVGASASPEMGQSPRPDATKEGPVTDPAPDRPPPDLTTLIDTVARAEIVGDIALVIRTIATEIAKETLNDPDFRASLRALVRERSRAILAAALRLRDEPDGGTLGQARE